MHTSSRTHPACVIVPAALAAAEAAGDTPGAELLAGIVAGYDVEVRLSKAMGVQQQFDRGFHPSGVCGSIGAAAAAGRILSLSVDQMRACIALGAAQSSGLLTFEEDPSHMLKSFNTGVAARNGVYAALLAQRGFRGAPDVLTGRHSVLTPYSRPDPEPAKLLDGLGRALRDLLHEHQAACLLQPDPLSGRHPAGPAGAARHRGPGHRRGSTCSSPTARSR